MGKAWVTSPLGTSFIAYSDPGRGGLVMGLPMADYGQNRT